jgi:hypothetical protein
MKKWLARKLFDIAIWLDWDEATIVAEAVTVSRFIATLDALTAPRKPGRPLGSKDKKPRKSPARKVKP